LGNNNNNKIDIVDAIIEVVLQAIISFSLHTQHQGRRNVSGQQDCEATIARLTVMMITLDAAPGSWLRT